MTDMNNSIHGQPKAEKQLVKQLVKASHTLVWRMTSTAWRGLGPLGLTFLASTRQFPWGQTVQTEPKETPKERNVGGSGKGDLQQIAVQYQAQLESKQTAGEQAN